MGRVHVRFFKHCPEPVEGKFCAERYWNLTLSVW